MHILPKTLLTQTTQLILNQNVEIHIQNKIKTVLISPFFSDLAAYFLSPVPKLQPKTPKRIKKNKTVSLHQNPKLFKSDDIGKQITDPQLSKSIKVDEPHFPHLPRLSHLIILLESFTERTFKANPLLHRLLLQIPSLQYI